MVEFESDRELLELAAKALGLVSYNYESKETYADCYGNVRAWNPLEYDEDAYRLMVQLKLRINYDTVIEYDVVEVFGPERDDFSCDCTTETIEEDQCASVRRAIVRAAARIGKQMLDNK